MTTHMFKDHLQLILMHSDTPITFKDVHLEWEWWVREHNLELNCEAWCNFSRALISFKDYIEDYPK